MHEATILHFFSVKSKSKSQYDRRSVSQSVSMSWCRAQSGTFDQRFFFSFSKFLFCLLGAPSLTRGRVCHVSVFVIEVYNNQSLFTKIFTFKLRIYNVKHIYNTIYTGLVQSRLCTADYALLTSFLVYHGSLNT
jgi:hypothetical protein